MSLARAFQIAVSTLRCRRGVSAAEYAILAVGIIITVGGAVVLLNDPVNGAFAQVSSAINNTLDGLISLGNR